MECLTDHPALKDRVSTKPTKGTAMSDDQKVTIDGRDNSLSEMPDAQKEQLTKARAVNQETQRLQMQIVITRTARSSDAQALKQGLDGAIVN